MKTSCYTCICALLASQALAAPGQYPGGDGFTSSSYRAGSYTVTVTKGNVTDPNSINPALKFNGSYMDTACCNPVSSPD